jgi:hypothetical protein
MHDADDSTTTGFNAWLALSEDLGAWVSINTSPGPDFSTRNPAVRSHWIGLLDSSHPHSYRCDLSAGNLTEPVQAKQVKKKLTPK